LTDLLGSHQTAGKEKEKEKEKEREEKRREESKIFVEGKGRETSDGCFFSSNREGVLMGSRPLGPFAAG
jgi:hypothetical protein